jgi:four helix bundle protein
LGIRIAARRSKISRPQTKLVSWKDLEVWQVAHRLVLRVYEISREFPNEERYRLADQVCRSAASIPSNIAEGKGRSSRKEYVQFLTFARGSVEEVKYQLLLARDLGYVHEGTYAEISAGYDQVGRMLNGLIRSLKSQSRV